MWAEADTKRLIKGVFFSVIMSSLNNCLYPKVYLVLHTVHSAVCYVAYKKVSSFSSSCKFGTI